MSAVCGFPWVGEIDGKWHRCDMPTTHRGLHTEGGQTFVAPTTRRGHLTHLPQLVGTCRVCGGRIQRNGVNAAWKHARPQPDGTPHDHAPKVAR